MLKILTACFGLFGRGRSPALLLNLVTPRSGYEIRRAIAYGQDARQRLDVYMPLKLTAPAPVVLFFYGGAFRAGRRDEYRVVGEALASRNIVAIIADYRIYPPARFPDFLEDGAKALAAVYGRAAEFGGAAARIFLAGHSAGAYIAVMLASNPAYLRAANADPSWVRGIIAIAGRYHELPLNDSVIRDIFRGPARPETRPASFIDGKRAPMLLAAGAEDSPEVLESHRKLAAHLREHGNEVEDITYPHTGHMGIVLALAPGFRRRAPLREDIVRFVAKH